MMIPEINLAERILLNYWKRDFQKGEITFDEYTSKVWHLAKGKDVVPGPEKPPLVLEDGWNSKTGKYQKTCKMCSETFEGRKNQIYCSKECRSAFNNEKAANRKTFVPGPEKPPLVCKCNGTGTVKHENGKCLVPCFDCDEYSNNYPGYISAYNVSSKKVVPEQEKSNLVWPKEPCINPKCNKIGFVSKGNKLEPCTDCTRFEVLKRAYVQSANNYFKSNKLKFIFS